jgi:hypothetical protein
MIMRALLLIMLISSTGCYANNKGLILGDRVFVVAKEVKVDTIIEKDGTVELGVLTLKPGNKITVDKVERKKELWVYSTNSNK